MKHVALSLVVASLVTSAAVAQTAPTAPKKFPHFADSDSDGDGFLTQGEWDASGRSAKRFRQVDADHDGKVTRAELSTATAAAKAAAAAEYQSKP